MCRPLTSIERSPDLSRLPVEVSYFSTQIQYLQLANKELQIPLAQIDIVNIMVKMSLKTRIEALARMYAHSSIRVYMASFHAHGHVRVVQGFPHVCITVVYIAKFRQTMHYWSILLAKQHHIRYHGHPPPPPKITKIYPGTE